MPDNWHFIGGGGGNRVCYNSLIKAWPHNWILFQQNYIISLSFPIFHIFYMMIFSSLSKCLQGLRPLSLFIVALTEKMLYLTFRQLLLLLCNPIQHDISMYHCARSPHKIIIRCDCTSYVIVWKCDKTCNNITQRISTYIMCLVF